MMEKDQSTPEMYKKMIMVDKGIFTYEETTTAVQQELGYWVARVSPTGPPAPDDDVSLSRS